MNDPARPLPAPASRLPAELCSADLDEVRARLRPSMSALCLDATAVRSVSIDIHDAFVRLASDADRLGIDIILDGAEAELQLVLEAGRLHRRICTPQVVVSAPPPRDEPALALIDTVSRDPQHLASTLEDSEPAVAADLLRWLMGYEDTLYESNVLAPYRDVLPAVLSLVSPRFCARALGHLSSAEAARLLFGDYTEVPDQRVAAILETVPAPRVAELFSWMLGHPDLRRRIAGVLRVLPQQVRNAALQLEPGLVSLVDADLGHNGQSDSPTAWAPDAVERYASGHGIRRSRTCTAGRHVEIEEVLDGPFGPKRVRIDLLELDLTAVRLEAYTAGQERPAHAEFEALFAPFAETGRPTEAAFRQAGLFRLGEAAAQAGAVAALNGGFYFDYGHYTNGKTLGLDFSTSAGLRFGDPIGYFVSNGTEVSAPIFNRATFLVTDQGVYIRRVKLVGLQGPRASLRWSAANIRDADAGAVLFSSLWGTTSPAEPDRVHLVVADGQVTSIVHGGAAPIPFTGVVISLRKGAPELEAFPPGTAVQSITDIPDDLGRVQQAVACGPALMRNGRVALDFDGEEFGRKDSPVISFFLPRLAESYEAARSFIGTRADGTVVLGTISGRAFGSGGQDASAGMTFGEMAVLAGDLGLVDAMGLDGGGSSSLDILGPDGLEVLNVPTGGSDVPRGSERFIANALLVLRR